jgi:hypothetical protein
MLKSASILGAVVLAAAASLTSGAAQARVFIGFGFGVPYYAPAPYYYGPPAVVYAPPPVVYAPPPVAYVPPQPRSYVSNGNQSWYYCDDPRGYYPNVQTCNQGWREVPARPAGQ